MGIIIKKDVAKKKAYMLLAVGFWILIWELVSRHLDNEILLASPSQVLFTIIKLGKTAEFWMTIFNSSLHILIGFLVALFLGNILAILAYRLGCFRELISPMIKVIKATPVASFIILVLFWFNNKQLSTIISFLMVLPIVYLNVLQGLQSADEKLLQFAKVYRLSFWKRVHAIYIPAVLPYLLTAISIGLGFGFKSGIAAEVIGIPAKSIGRKLYEAKLYLMTKEMLAWTVVIILISVIIEKAVLFLIGSWLPQADNQDRDSVTEMGHDSRS